VVGGAGKEAADPSDGDSDRERRREEISRAGADARAPLGELDADPAAEQAPHDRLSVNPEGGAAPSAGKGGDVGDRRQQPRAGERPERRRQDHEPSLVVRYRIALAEAQISVEDRAGGVSERFEDQM
jgi:hypothetical protein